MPVSSFIIRKKEPYGDHPSIWFMANVCVGSCGRPFNTYLFSFWSLFFLGIFFLLLLLLFPSHQCFFFSPQEFISNLDRHSDTMFALICTLFMRKFRCQIIIVGQMTCTSVLCVCCACVWMLFFWFVYADRQSYNVNNIYCGVQSHRMLLVNTRIHIGLVQWNDDIYFHSQWAYMKQCNQMRMMFYVADLLYYLYTAVFLLALLFHCFMQRDCAFLSRNSIADMDFINIVSAWELRE